MQQPPGFVYVLGSDIANFLFLTQHKMQTDFVQEFLNPQLPVTHSPTTSRQEHIVTNAVPPVKTLKPNMLKAQPQIKRKAKIAFVKFRCLIRVSSS